jgi:hypothetical protein
MIGFSFLKGFYLFFAVLHDCFLLLCCKTRAKLGIGWIVNGIAELIARLHVIACFGKDHLRGQTLLHGSFADGLHPETIHRPFPFAVTARKVSTARETNKGCAEFVVIQSLHLLGRIVCFGSNAWTHGHGWGIFFSLFYFFNFFIVKMTISGLFTFF